MAAAAPESLLTAEEYLALPDNGVPNELIRGRIVSMNLPTPRHGEICLQTAYLVRRFLDNHHLGRLVGNDSGVVTQHDPDTVRGADVAFYSYSRVPPGPMPQGYLPVIPELVFEVRSSSDRWGRILAKIAEYLEAGVKVVCVLDQMTERCHVYRNEEEIQVILPDEVLTIPDVLPEFQVVVRRFFE
ncbi:MAG: Uma2 family endonuclease [Gemmataceae bacterium]